MAKIIDNKKVDITEDEYKYYQKLCNDYKNGKDLFRDLFEVDDSGLIIFLRPPKKMFSMEIVLFLQNIMIHQHLRRVYAEHQEALKELRAEIQQLKETKK